jgi:hypothetical protein
MTAVIGYSPLEELRYRKPGFVSSIEESLGGVLHPPAADARERVQDNDHYRAGHRGQRAGNHPVDGSQANAERHDELDCQIFVRLAFCLGDLELPCPGNLAVARLSRFTAIPPIEFVLVLGRPRVRLSR